MRAGPSQSSQTRNFPHLRPTTGSLTGVSKEQSALFNHSKHDDGGGGGGMEQEAPFPWLEPGEGRVCWQSDGWVEEAARLPCLCSTCSPKCKVASRQFWARSEKRGGGWHGTPSYASWVTEIKTNLERCLVNRALHPLLRRAASALHPPPQPFSHLFLYHLLSSLLKPTPTSTPTLPPTHPRQGPWLLSTPTAPAYLFNLTSDKVRFAGFCSKC